MILDILFKVLLQALLFNGGSARCQDGRSHELVFAWKAGDPNTQVDFNWPNETFRQRYERTRRSPPVGIKVYKDSVYISFPRWRPTGYPVNMARVARPGNSCIQQADSPILEAYPSWDMNQLDNCDAIQFVQAFEVDPNEGELWMADTGRQFGSEVKCMPKMIIMDLETDTVKRVHIFPRSVVSRTKSFLNDMVLDLTDPSGGKFAYISESDDGSIVVYDYKNDKSWKAKHLTFLADISARSFDFINPPAHRDIPDSSVNSIAFSPQSKRVLYSPLTSFSTFAIPSSVLRSESLATDSSVIDKNFQILTDDKPSQSDGMTIDRSGKLYMTEVVTNTISKWDPAMNQDFRQSRTVLAQDNRTMIWPDTLAIDEQGYLWASTRGWPIDRDVNSIIRIYIGETSYTTYN